MESAKQQDCIPGALGWTRRPGRASWYLRFVHTCMVDARATPTSPRYARAAVGQAHRLLTNAEVADWTPCGPAVTSASIIHRGRRIQCGPSVFVLACWRGEHLACCCARPPMIIRTDWPTAPIKWGATTHGGACHHVLPGHRSAPQEERKPSIRRRSASTTGTPPGRPAEVPTRQRQGWANSVALA